MAKNRVNLANKEKKEGDEAIARKQRLEAKPRDCIARHWTWRGGRVGKKGLE